MRKPVLATAFALLPLAPPVLAHEAVLAGNTDTSLADRHGPIGVMGDHRHRAGEWMISYRFMHMDMDGMRKGGRAIADKDIVTTVANPFPGPATVRVVPVEMTTEMHMIGAMYAPSDRMTLMAMVNYLDRDMDLMTYQGMMGAEPLGGFSTASSGFGDTRVSALWGLFDTRQHSVHLNLGVSLPTGSIRQRASVLTPMGETMKMRLPYGMQLGSGTWDLEPGITYNGYRGIYAWGAQYRATLRLGENSEDYTLGDRHQFTAWGSARAADWLSMSLRLTYSHQDDISGRDPLISAPVTTANPDSYGGERVDLGIGVNLAGQGGALRGHRLALEYELPVSQNVNGVQMEMKSMLTLGYQYAF